MTITSRSALYYKTPISLHTVGQPLLAAAGLLAGSFAMWGRLVTCRPISNRPSSLVLALTALLFSIGPSHAADKLNVISSTQDLASIAAEVGGDKITVESIA